MNLKKKTLISFIVLLIGVLTPIKFLEANSQTEAPQPYTHAALTTPDAVITLQSSDKLSWDLLISARAYRVKGKLITALKLLHPRIPQNNETNTSTLALYAELEIAWNLTEAGYTKEAQIIVNRYSEPIKSTNDSVLLSLHFFIRGFIAEKDNPPLASELFNNALLTNPLNQTTFRTIIQSHLAKLYLDGNMVSQAEKVLLPLSIPELASSNSFLFRDAITANLAFLLRKNREQEAMAFLNTAITAATLISDTATLFNLYYLHLKHRKISTNTEPEPDQGAYILLTQKNGWGAARQTFINDTSLINDLEKHLPGCFNKLPSLLSKIYYENYLLASTVSQLVLFPSDEANKKDSHQNYSYFIYLVLIFIIIFLSFKSLKTNKKNKKDDLPDLKTFPPTTHSINESCFSTPIIKQSITFFNLAVWSLKKEEDQVYYIKEMHNVESIPIIDASTYFESTTLRWKEIFSKNSEKLIDSLIEESKSSPWIWHKRIVTLNPKASSSKSLEIFSFGTEDNEISFLLKLSHDDTQVMSKRFAFPSKELFNLIPTPIFVKDKYFRLVYINQAFIEVIRKNPDQLIGKTDFDLFPPTQAEAFRASDEKVLRGITHSFEDESHHKTETTHYYITKKLITNPTNQEPYIFGIMHDISLRVNADQGLIRMRDEAMQLTKNKSEFLANMSHEIRTPMNAILGMAELLGESALDTEQRELTGIVFKAANNLLQLINDILDLSKIEAGQIKIRQEPYFLSTLIHEIVSMLNYSRQDKAVEIIINIDSKIPDQLIGDEFRLRQIITNLTNNALKFTKQGNVTINGRLIEHPSPFLRFDITDTGTGIPEEHLPHLFNPFYQVDNKSKLPRGTGLGLAISKQLTIAMGGQIGVESTLGKGSNFWFTLPIKQQIIFEKGIENHESEKSISLNFLLVEDNATNQQLLVANLRKFNLKTTLADNGKEAVEFFKTGSFDMILMDIQMPIMDGLEATRLIREYESINNLDRTPIVAVTAFTIENELNSDFDGFLRKPYHSDDLRSLLLKFFPNIEQKK